MNTKKEKPLNLEDSQLLYNDLRRRNDEAIREISTLKPIASQSDIGKALLVKTVANGIPTSYEYGEAGGGGGTSDYTDLSNKPSINSHELVGNKTAANLGLATTGEVSAKYTKPSGGIPSSDMTSDVQTSLGKADTAYQKPGTGIPASDLASGVLTGIIDDTAGDGDTNKTWSADKLYDDITAKVNKPATAGTSGQVLSKGTGDATAWIDVAAPTDAQVETAVTTWLNNHPEATTTVQDGSITYAKLDSDLQAAIDNIGTSELYDVDYDDQNYLHFYDKDGEELYGGPFYIEGGGGGGGTSSIALTNVVKVDTVRNGADAIFSFTATSSDATDITVRWYVDDILKLTSPQQSGTSFTFNAGPYLRPSNTSNVRADILSEGGGTLTRQWIVTSTAFSLSWGATIQPITLYTTNENVYAVVNVTAQAGTSNTVTVTVGRHNKAQSVVGSRSITVELDKSWFSVGSNTVVASMVSDLDPTDRADDITYVALWGYGAQSPIVAFADSILTGMQYDTVGIRYFVYDPSSETAECEIQIDTEPPRTIVAGRTMRTLQYVPQTFGTSNVTLTCGQASDYMVLVITESEYNIGKVTGDSLRYDLDPVGHSNADADREEFGDLTFCTGFDWVNGGFQQDAAGATAFVVKKGDWVTMPRSLFADSDGNGKVIDVSFKITNSDQYDAVAMQDMNNSGTKGLILRANAGELRLDNAAGQEFRYCEENRIDFSVMVEAVTDQRLVTVWLDGVPSKTDKYETSMLVQSENNARIGSDHCDIWIYAIHIYNAELSLQEMIQNYISLGSTTADKVERCKSNSIYDANDKITPASLHAASPDLTIIEISADRMTVNKSDKVPADIRITDGTNVLNLSRSDQVVFMVQGTSSAAYGRSNYNLDIDFKKTSSTYKISETSIPVAYMNIKVNVASSENANNVNAVDWYNTYQPYITEPRTRPGVRDTIEAKPCAVFFTNTSNEAQWFSSQLVQPGETILYAMGDLCNSKKNTDVFGEDGSGTHPTKCCIEVSGNDTPCQQFLSDAAVYNAEKGEWQTTRTEGGETIVTKEYEWRMEPDDNDLQDCVDAWDDLVSWVVSTVNDSQKFYDEIGDYFAVDSMLFHFLMIEYFSAYDNVSKNTFYSYDWDEDAQKYLWNIKAAYDWDTIIASDNDGKPFGDYGIDYGDTVGGRSYFNAVDNPIWCNIQAAFQSELSAMYISLRSQGAWDAANILTKWDTYQSKRPRAAMAQDAVTKYILPYKTTGVVIDGTTLAYDDSYLPRLQGSKTYQRRQFMTYQGDYMDGKYGYYSKSVSTQFRTNCESGQKDFTVKVYAKTYITVVADDNKVASLKVNAGGTATFQNVSVGSNTTLYFTPDRLIQYIRPLNETQNSTFAASGAAKLMEAILGGATANTAWLSGTSLNVPSALLKTLSVRNMVNFSSALNLSANVELEELDTRGTNTGRITLPSYAPLETIQLNACTGIAADHLNDVQTFTMASGQNLLSVRMENCNATMMNAMQTYMLEASDLQNARCIGVNWTMSDATLLNKLLNTGSIDDSGQAGNAPATLTGDIFVSELRSIEKDEFEAAWPEVNLTYGVLIPQYTVTFLDWDDSPILDTQGHAYVQYVDSGSNAYDPITAGEVNAPTRAPTQQYTYTYSGWDNLPVGVISNRTVHATYTSTLRKYTVTVKDGIPGSGATLATYANLDYGSAVDIFALHPTYTAREATNVYYVHTGWDKSAGYVTGDTTINATWDTGNMPVAGDGLTPGEVGTTGHYSWANLRALQKNRAFDAFFQPKDHIDFRLGHDFVFDSGSASDPGYVKGYDLVSQPTFFNSSTAPIIFNGQNGNPLIQPFKGSGETFDNDRFTLAVDYEFSGDTGVLCAVGTSGLQVRRNGNYINVVWGDTSRNIGYQYQRGVVVLRWTSAYPSNLYVTHDGCTTNASGSIQSDYRYTINTSHPESNIVTTTLVRSVLQPTDSPLTVGGVGYLDGTDMTSVRPSGWAHWAKYWCDDLGTYAVKMLASMPRLQMRYNYTGIKYQDGINSPSTVAGGFCAENTLPMNGTLYYATSALANGWAGAERRAWLNGQFFDALPLAMQVLIDDAEVRSTVSGSSTLPSYPIVSSLDKVYVPAYAEVYTVSGGSAEATAYLDEQAYGSPKQIPYFTNNSSRIKIIGYSIPDDVVYITLEYDPTTPGVGPYSIVSEKTIWIYGSRYYVYIDADFIARHKFFGGRLVSHSDNINAVGADTAGHTGGKWVISDDWNTRTPYPTSYMIHYISDSGSTGGSSSSSYGILTAFSL